MAKNHDRGSDPRKIWSANLAPLAMAAREGTAQAVRTARRERARARRRDEPWWKQSWLMVTAGGLMVAGAAGATFQAVARRRTAAGSAEAGSGPGPGGGSPTQAIMSTVENGRERVTEAARTMLHKIRREGSDQLDPGLAPTGSAPVGTTPASRGADLG